MNTLVDREIECKHTLAIRLAAVASVSMTIAARRSREKCISALFSFAPFQAENLDLKYIERPVFQHVLSFFCWCCYAFRHLLLWMRLFIVRTTCAIKIEHHFNC